MAYARRLGMIGILGACYFVVVGCSDDEDRKAVGSEGGEGGDDGSAGKVNAGGNQNLGGKAGSAGNAGNGGSNVTPEGGTGAGGEAGSVGIVAGSGGETPGGAGEAGAPSGGSGGSGDGGASGATGAGGEAGGPTGPLSCAYECTPGTPCTGADASAACDAETGRCVTEAEGDCVEKDDCAPSQSFWSATPCANTGECDEGEACIEWQGANMCAILADADLGCLMIFGLVPTDMPEVGAQGDVSICLAPGICVDGTCDMACDHPFSDCAETCEPTTGLCGCSIDDDCGNKVCFEGQCVECKIDDDCPGTQGLDKCTDHRCGCSSVSACPNPFNNATKLCE